MIYCSSLGVLNFLSLISAAIFSYSFERSSCCMMSTLARSSLSSCCSWMISFSFCVITSSLFFIWFSICCFTALGVICLALCESIDNILPVISPRLIARGNVAPTPSAAALPAATIPAYLGADCKKDCKESELIMFPLFLEFCVAASFPDRIQRRTVSGFVLSISDICLTVYSFNLSPSMSEV